jgi:hypothetical protein
MIHTDLAILGRLVSLAHVTCAAATADAASNTRRRASAPIACVRRCADAGK